MSEGRWGMDMRIEKIKHEQKKYGIRIKARKFPMMCVLSVVYICNARCPNCPYTNSQIRVDYRDRPFMEEDTFKIIADQCGKYGAWVRISGGGEPMLHPKAIELMEYAKRVGAKVGLITNGSLFSIESSTRLLEAQIDMIEFSVDAGDCHTYEKVRKGLKWDVLLRNVKEMVKLRNRLRSSTKIIASGINQIDVNIDTVAEFWKPIVDNFQKRKYLTWGISDPSKSADATPYLPLTEMVPCPFIFERLNVDSRGQVMVCGFDIRARTNMGNVHERTIEEIWHGEGFEYYRKMHLEKRGAEVKLCKDCPDWKYRSWRHNYWKIVKNAEKRRRSQVELLDSQDVEGCITDH
jgi:radical SAM protein with 4Fe4S-binding SPASM domain